MKINTARFCTVKFSFAKFLVVSALAVVSTMPVHAQTFTFRWDSEQETDPSADSKWENPVNWFEESPGGLNHNNAAPVNLPEEDPFPAANFNVAVRNGGTVDFDDATSLALAGAVDAPVFVDRFFLGAPGSGSGSGTLNVSGGFLNASRSGAGINNTIGRAQDGTLNISGGEVHIGHRVFAGSGVNGHGEINLSDGVFNIYRGGNSSIMTLDDIAAYGRPSLDLGLDDGGTDPVLNTTTGIFNISGGEFRTRVGVAIGARGTFDVQGSGASSIGIGSQGNIDGYWLQYAGSVLRAGVDSGGITPIFVDEVDGDTGASNNGDVKFYSGTFLDPYDMGGAPTNFWHTVMEWEGTLQENGLALTADAMTDGWEMRVDGNELQIRLPGDGGPFGDADFDADNDVDGRDYLTWQSNVGFTGPFDLQPFGDATGDDVIDGLDLQVWQDQYGGGSALLAVSALPEPTSLVLLALGSMAMIGRRHRS